MQAYPYKNRAYIKQTRRYMNTYKLKSVARRGSMLGAAFAIVAASFLPALSASADALNPLTERSLTLSSASPGWSYLDSSGNPTYAPPNSGANGNQTGNTFSFRVSSDAGVKGFSFQYCTFPAGNCVGPGNIAGHGDNDTTAYANKQSDLQIKTASPVEVTDSYFTNKFNATTGQPNSDPTWTGINESVNPALRTQKAHPNLPARDNSDGNFIILHKTNLGDAWQRSKDWDMAATVKQDINSTNKENYVTLTKSALATDPSLPLKPGDYVKVIFFATDSNYIINPGDHEFFVKINTFKTNVPGDFITDTENPAATIIDGGVTVANVMNRSIEIQTKVLETMDFSVGTVDPVTLDSTGGATSQLATATGLTKHTPCAPIVRGMGGSSTLPENVLQLGNADGEFSLKTDRTYSTHSYWRLSSNSSGGATVYYSGVTLSNTVGDQIKAIGPNESTPTRGNEQFGLALAHATGTPYAVDYTKERAGTEDLENGADNAAAGISASFLSDMAADSLTYHTPQLAPLSAKANYGDGAGVINAAQYPGATTAKFAFDPQSAVIPTPFAEGTEVLDCVTGKMRYVANIAATTPAGVYTTKINYIAAPQY